MKILRFFLVLGALFLLFPRVGAAEETYHIRKIEISGTMRIERETVLSYLMIKDGDIVTKERLDQALKSLFATGLFADVRLDVDKDGVLKVDLVENPVVNQIIFEGNKRIKSEQLAPELTLRPRAVYTRSKVRRDTQRILEIYKRSGRYSVSVEPKIIERSQNRLDVVFEIAEGPTTYIRKINFIGNKSYDHDRLEDAMMSKEKRWYRFFTATDTYDPDRFAYDQELLRRFYMQHGYMDFAILSSSAELSPNRENFFLTVVMDEGPRYRVGTVKVVSLIKGLEESEIEGEISVKSGDWLNIVKLEDNVLALTNEIGAMGFPFVDVTYKLEKRKDEPVTDVLFEIKEGPHLFIDRINITGNVRTEDSVIRRQFRFAEGDAYNPAKIRRSKQRIENLDFFERVNLDITPSAESPDVAEVNLDVSEKSTGSLRVGVGWSSYDGPLAEISIQERNLLGTGRSLGAMASVAQERTLFDISFVEPWFLDRELSAGFDVFYLTRNYEERSSYDSEMYGASTFFGWKYSEELSHSVKYTLRRDEITNVDPTASIYVKEQEGERTTSMISQTLFWDYLDNRINPSEGYFFSFSNDLAGLGGDTHYLRTDARFGYYIPLSDQWVLGLTTSAGYIYGLGEDVRLNDRYFLGGGDLRGFEEGGVTARAKVGGDSLGGNWQFTASAQVMFPLGLPSEFGMKGKIFADAGFAGKPDNFDASTMWYSSKMRASIGVGLLWSSPLGPINIDFAIPVLKEDFDKTEYFRLHFDTGF